MSEPPTTQPPLPPEDGERGEGSGADSGSERKRSFAFPSAFTVLAIVTVVVWGLAFVIPSGQYRLTADGAPIPKTYHEVPAPENFKGRLNDLYLSPVNGLYGIKDAKSGKVGPYNSGDLYGSAGVFFFVLAVGAFVTVMFATGSLERGIGLLAYRMKDRGWLLIVAIMVVFSVLGTVEGFAEETLGFYGLVVPLMLALGYDRMVAVGTIICGAGVGVMGSTVNPFSIGVASSVAGVSIGDGIVLRVVMWLVLTAVTIAYVVRYAHKVRANPEASLVGFAVGDRDQAVKQAETEPPPLTGRHKAVLALVGFTFAFMIFSLIPWASIISGIDASPYSWELDWYFPELAALFIVAAVVIGLVGGLGEKRLTDTIAKGAGDFIYPALVKAFPRARRSYRPRRSPLSSARMSDYRGCDTARARHGPEIAGCLPRFVAVGIVAAPEMVVVGRRGG